jgi:hypothetical protein
VRVARRSRHVANLTKAYHLPRSLEESRLVDMTRLLTHLVNGLPLISNPSLHCARTHQALCFTHVIAHFPHDDDRLGAVRIDPSGLE